MNRNGDSKQSDFNNMTFHEFDQSEDGVRKLAKAGDFKAAGETIVNYIAANNEKLTPAQRCLIWFHAGQNAAFANQYIEAIAFLEKASETVPDTKNPGKRTYALSEFMGFSTECYLQATIAFLKNDKAALRTVYEKMNMNILDYPKDFPELFPGRVHDMLEAQPGTTYADVWNLPPSFPPLPGEKESAWHRKPDDNQHVGIFGQKYRDKLEAKQAAKFGIFKSIDTLKKDQKEREAKSKSVKDLAPEEREKIIFSPPSSSPKK